MFSGNIVYIILTLFNKLLGFVAGNCHVPSSLIGGGNLDCMSTSNDLHKGCLIRCPSQLAPLWDGPSLLTCGPSGLWNKENPREDYRFPTCGSK